MPEAPTLFEMPFAGCGKDSESFIESFGAALAAISADTSGARLIECDSCVTESDSPSAKDSRPAKMVGDAVPITKGAAAAALSIVSA